MDFNIREIAEGWLAVLICLLAATIHSSYASQDSSVTLLWARPSHEKTETLTGTIGMYVVDDFKKLPLMAQSAQIPWFGYYWPGYKNSINNKIDRTISPLSKYAKAFDILPVPSTEQYKEEFKAYGHYKKTRQIHRQVSEQYGWSTGFSDIRCSQSSPCGQWQECSGKKVTTVNENYMSHGVERMRKKKVIEDMCIDKWLGLCDGLALASMKPQPQHFVQIKNQVFTPEEIKALLAYAVAGVPTQMIPRSCGMSADEVRNIQTDPGKKETEICGPMNAGTFHLLITNWIGIKKDSIVFNLAEKKDEVWNYVAFNFTSTVLIDYWNVNRIRVRYPKRQIHPDTTLIKKMTTTVFFRQISMEKVGYVSDAEMAADRDMRFNKIVNFQYELEINNLGIIVGGRFLTKNKKRPKFAWVAPLEINPVSDLQTQIYRNIQDMYKKSAGLEERPAAAAG